MAETAGIAIALKAIGSQLFEDAIARKRAVEPVGRVLAASS
ncbi:hypothetical protein AB0L63_03915 [Nocardia sp. NPDC051990]